ncbi:hypothetical protein TUBRATIS_13220 [Tubulinosema ratisbonensis]|uniref:Uncharacterized protein n=1 Tax=Tubulinosema ratisbonensis TaxID=291195 RepID=A0A437ALY2_9MICR|nr:hypothetical protein TUBRATIS_13220 [Tubulinosema ratisbonensis]
MIILIYLLKIKLASNFLDDSTEPKKKFDVSQFERSPFFQDFFPIDDCVHQAKDNSSKDLEVLNNNQNPETEENSGQLQKFKVREDDRDDRKVVKAKIFKKKR